jgi:hypothetical protein
MTDSLWRKRQEPEALKRITRDDTEHDKEYYLALEVDALLAQPEQEPVAWMRHDGQRVTTASDRHNYSDYETRYSIPLYTTPQQRKPPTA